MFIKDSLFRCIVLDIKNDFILSDIWMAMYTNWFWFPQEINPESVCSITLNDGDDYDSGSSSSDELYLL